METRDIIALIIVGLVAGTAAAAIMNRSRSKTTRDWLRNMVIGVAGAFVGAILFDLLDISLPDILSGEITPADVLVAFIGAVLVIFAARLIER